MDSGGLSDGQITAVAEAAIERQARSNAVWDTTFGDLVQVARTRGLAGDASWNQYARHAPRLTLEARRVVRRGDVLPYAVIMQPARVGGPTHPLGLYLSQRVAGVRVDDGQPHPVDDEFVRMHGPKPISVHRSWLGENRFLRLPDLEPGSYKLTFVLDLAVTAPQSTQRDGPVLAAWQEVVDVNVTVVSPETETVTLASDPALDDAVRRAVALAETQPVPGAPRREAIVARGGGGIADVAIRTTNLPVGVAFDAFLRDATGVEQRIGQFTAAAGPGRAGGFSFHESVLRSLTGERLDVVLRASPDAARRTVNLTSIWGGELVLRDVPVVWLTPPARTGPGEGGQ